MTGTVRDARTAMIAMTTSNSISVKAPARGNARGEGIPCFTQWFIRNPLFQVKEKPLCWKTLKGETQNENREGGEIQLEGGLPAVGGNAGGRRTNGIPR